MAIAGGMTTAYKVRLKDRQISIVGTTYPSDKCNSPSEAVGIVASGGEAVLRGSDVIKFNEMWKKR